MNLWWWSIVFVVWLTDERCLALFPAGTIVRDLHHRKSPARREQGLSLPRTWVQAQSNDCNWTRTQNHLVLKRTFNHLAKLAIQEHDKNIQSVEWSCAVVITTTPRHHKGATKWRKCYWQKRDGIPCVLIP